MILVGRTAVVHDHGGLLNRPGMYGDWTLTMRLCFFLPVLAVCSCCAMNIDYDVEECIILETPNSNVAYVGFPCKTGSQYDSYCCCSGHTLLQFITTDRPAIQVYM